MINEPKNFLNHKIKLNEISTKDIIYYIEEEETRCINFCKKRNISFLPHHSLSKIYKFNEDLGKFNILEIREEQKISENTNVFDYSLKDRFKQENILFVYDNELLTGVVHFCDYNKNIVYIYLYTMLLEVERLIRVYLINKNIKEQEVVESICNKIAENDKKDKKRSFKRY